MRSELKRGGREDGKTGKTGRADEWEDARKESYRLALALAHEEDRVG